jgi:hypothetical protein
MQAVELLGYGRNRVVRELLTTPVWVMGQFESRLKIGAEFVIVKVLCLSAQKLDRDPNEFLTESF